MGRGGGEGKRKIKSAGVSCNKRRAERRVAHSVGDRLLGLFLEERERWERWWRGRDR